VRQHQRLEAGDVGHGGPVKDRSSLTARAGSLFPRSGMAAE